MRFLHRRRLNRSVVALLVMLIVAAILAIARDRAEAASYELLVSTSSDRSDPSPLDGGVVVGDIAVFTSPEAGVSQVRFLLDGAPYRTENNPPFDFNGGSTTNAALFGTTTLTDGPHAITAEIDDAAGTNVIAATFTVANAAPALDFTPNTLVFEVDEGGSAPSQTAGLDTTDGSTAAYTLSDDANWLSMSPSSGSTPETVSLSIDAAGLPAGTYAATVVASSSGYTPAALPVTLIVGDGGSESITGISWSTAAAAPIARTEAQGGNVGGLLYIFGGYVDVSPLIATTRSDVYDPVADTWTRIPDMPAAVTHAAAVVDGTDIYLIGGYETISPGDSIATDAAWKYDTVNETWTSLPPLPERRGSGGAALFGRDLHFFGGADLDHLEHDDHWVLSLDGGGWTTGTAMPDPKTHMGVAQYGGKVYVFGGEKGGIGGTDQASVHSWDPAFPNTWTTLTPLPIPLSHTPGATLVIGDQIILVGGETNPNTAIDTVHVYDPIADGWGTLTDLPDLRKAGMAGVFDGEIIYAGGSRLGGAIQTTTYRGIPTTGGGGTPGSYDVLVSSSPDRSGSESLDGATVAGDIAVFTAPEGGVTQVRFFLDGSPHQTENSPPFDFNGTSGADAVMFDSTTISDGLHTITTEIDDASGTTTVSADFTVANTVPSLLATPTSISWTLPEDGTTTDTATFTASDAAAVAIDVSDDAPWLTTTPTSGTTPLTVDLDVDATGLAPGTYNATVTATNPGGSHLDATVDVSLEVVSQSLRFNPTSHSLTLEEGESTSLAATLSAVDGSVIAADVSDDAPWLTTTPTSGTTPLTVDLDVDATGLAAGTYNATVTATDPGGAYDTTSLPVQLTVTEPGSYDLLVSTSSDRSSPVPLHGATVAGDIAVFTSPDTGVSRVRFFLDGSLHRTENNGPFDFNGGSATAARFYDTADLSDGLHTITAEIDDASGTTTVSADFTVANTAPSLLTTPTSMSFDVPEDGVGADTATFTASDGSAVVIDVGDDASWLTLTPNTGTTPLAVDLTADTAGLAPGTYNAIVTATDPGGGHLPATLPVQLTVTTTTLEASPASLDFSVDEGDTDSSGVSVTASDAAAVGFQVGTDAPWLGATPTSGTTPETVTVTVDTTGLGAGTYNGTVTMTDPTGTYDPIQVPISLDVTTPGSYDLLVSTSTDRSSPVALDGATISGDVAVFTAPDTGVRRVRFTLDGSPHRTENNGPFDFNGGSVNSARLYPTTDLGNGSHTIGADVELIDGTTVSIAATFTVANP